MSRKQTLSQILTDYQPRPGQRFYQTMDNAPWQSQKRKTMQSHATPLFRSKWQIAIVVLVVLVALGVSLPSVRASLSAWLGLSVAPANQMPAEAVTLVALPTPTAANTQPAAAPQPSPVIPEASPLAPTQAPTQAVSDEILQLSAQAGWRILTPSRLPKEYHLEGADFDANHAMAILTYVAQRPLPGATDPTLTETKTITLLEAPKNDFVPLQIAPDAVVTDVQVNSQPAAFVIGAWDTSFVPNDQDPNGGQMVSTWRNDLPVKNLFWQVGTTYLAIITDDEAVSQAEMIDMAASIGQ